MNIKNPSFFTVLTVIWLMGFAYTFFVQETHKSAVMRDYEAASARLSEAREKNEALKAERQILESPEYIEKVAREDLGMTRHGELPYIAAPK